MVKKQKNVVWLTWLIAIVAIVALVLAIVAINKVNMTGNAFWHFKQNAELRAMENVQAQTDMTNYIAVYDENGEKALEMRGSEIIYNAPRFNSNVNQVQNMAANQTNISVINTNGTSDEPFGSLLLKICRQGCLDNYEACLNRPGPNCIGAYEECVTGCKALAIFWSVWGSFN